METQPESEKSYNKEAENYNTFLCKLLHSWGGTMPQIPLTAGRSSINHVPRDGLWPCVAVPAWLQQNLEGPPWLSVDVIHTSSGCVAVERSVKYGMIFFLPSQITGGIGWHIWERRAVQRCAGDILPLSSKVAGAEPSIPPAIPLSIHLSPNPRAQSLLSHKKTVSPWPLLFMTDLMQECAQKARLTLSLSLPLSFSLSLSASVSFVIISLCFQNSALHFHTNLDCNGGRT